VTRSASFDALGTTATVVVARAGVLSDARRLLRVELERIDDACSRFRPDSELARANALAGERIRVSGLFAEALQAALDAAADTGGLVTPALGGPLAAAGYDRTFRLVVHGDPVSFEPVPQGRDAWRGIRVDVGRGEVVVPEGIQLDLGATAKALAADRAAALIAASTGSGVLVSLGGDIAVAGTPPPDGWAVRIAEDHSAPLHAPGPVVAIRRGGLATSSSSVRRWRMAGAEAHHVFDPRTGAPAESDWRTVTATGATCVAANVAATLGIVAGSAAQGWLEQRGIPARVVRRDGSVILLGAWPRPAEAA